MSEFIDKDRWINLSLVHEREIYDLQGKIADLGAEIERLKDVCVRNQNVSAELFDLCVTLKGENERLRKAGDAMVNHIRKGEEVLFECLDGDNVVAAWDAAKEGGAK